LIPSTEGRIFDFDIHALMMMHPLKLALIRLRQMLRRDKLGLIRLRQRLRRDKLGSFWVCFGILLALIGFDWL